MTLPIATLLCVQHVGAAVVQHAVHNSGQTMSTSDPSASLSQSAAAAAAAAAAAVAVAAAAVCSL